METIRQTAAKILTQTQTVPSPPRSAANAVCPDCDGTQYIRYDLPLGHPHFGRYAPCPTCNQATIQIISGLTPDERKITFEQVRTQGRPGTAKALEAALEFVKEPHGFLSLHGNFGNGKTTILMAIVNALVDQGVEARYITAAALMGYLRDTFNAETKESDYDRLHELAALPVLCIDEMDKLRDTPYSRELQQELINRRYREAGKLGTVLAWNGDLNALPWGAVTSRLSEFVVVHNTDSDMRKLLGVTK